MAKVIRVDSTGKIKDQLVFENDSKPVAEAFAANMNKQLKGIESLRSISYQVQ